MSSDAGATSGAEPRRRGLVGEAVVLAAGLADVAADGFGRVAARGRAVLGRADLAELAGQGRQDVHARGRLMIARFEVPPAYLEIVARTVVEARERADG